MNKQTADNSFAILSNRLIITAGHEIGYIENYLIHLTKPERQVIIESIVVNCGNGLLTTLILGSQKRNPSGLGLPPGLISKQQICFGKAIITGGTLAADLAPARVCGNFLFSSVR